MPTSARCRALLFFYVCVVVRTALAIWVGVGLPRTALWLTWTTASALLVVALFWTRIVCIAPRKVGFFGGGIWWTAARPLHIVLYCAAAILIFLRIYVPAAAVMGADVSVAVGGGLERYGMPCTNRDRTPAPSGGHTSHISHTQQPSKRREQEEPNLKI